MSNWEEKQRKRLDALGAIKSASSLIPRSRRSLYIDAELARFTLDADLNPEDFGQTGWGYDLDDETKDRLIAHARADAAHAVIAAHSAKTSAAKAVRLLYVLIALMIFCIWIVWTR